MALPKHQSEQFEEYIPKESTASFAQYQTSAHDKERIKEVIFFLNIAIFSIGTVLFSYIFLSHRVPGVISFCLAVIFSAFSMTLVRSAFRFRKQKRSSQNRASKKT